VGQSLDDGQQDDEQRGVLAPGQPAERRGELGVDRQRGGRGSMPPAARPRPIGRQRHQGPGAVERGAPELPQELTARPV